MSDPHGHLTQEVVFSPREKNVWYYGRVGCYPEEHHTHSDGPIAWHIFPLIAADSMHLYRVEKEKARLAFEREQTTPKVLCCVQSLSCLLKGFGYMPLFPFGTHQADACCESVICG